MSAPGSLAIAASVRARQTTAVAIAEAALGRIEEREPSIHAFTSVLGARALSRAAQIDDMVRAGVDPGPLCGVPFAAKDLFDIEGVVTLAGSKILASHPPARRSAAVVRQLEAAGAVLVGALNMEEFAYGFLTDNAHHGRTCNPHDTARTAGGSSGGTGAAVAADMVPLALGSDTNGSIRIPASFCGVVGMKPTFGRIDRSGMVPLAPSQDHVGWIGRSVEDVTLAWQVLSEEPRPATASHPPRIAVADGYFDRVLSDEARAAVARAAKCLGACTTVRIPACDAARGAAYAVTSSEASSLRLPDLRDKVEGFDPATRDRFLAGALLPAEWYIKAQRFSAWFRTEVAKLFERADVIVLPASPILAPRFGEETMVLDGETRAVRSTIGRFTQPISPLGLPIVCVPAAPLGQLPIGVQLVGRPGSEWLLLQTARTLESHFGAGTQTP
jgi:AtzE family amidohydrolase